MDFLTLTLWAFPVEIILSLVFACWVVDNVEKDDE